MPKVRDIRGPNITPIRSKGDIVVMRLTKEEARVVLAAVHVVTELGKMLGINIERMVRLLAKLHQWMNEQTGGL